MEYTKPELVIKEIEDDAFSVGIKKQAITGKTTKDCLKRGGKIRRVYRKTKEDESGETYGVFNVCEFDGKKGLEEINEEMVGSYTIIPISMLDEVIEELQALTRNK